MLSVHAGGQATLDMHANGQAALHMHQVDRPCLTCMQAGRRHLRCPCQRPAAGGGDRLGVRPTGELPNAEVLAGTTSRCTIRQPCSSTRTSCHSQWSPPPPAEQGGKGTACSAPPVPLSVAILLSMASTAGSASHLESRQHPQVSSLPDPARLAAPTHPHPHPVIYPSSGRIGAPKRPASITSGFFSSI